MSPFSLASGFQRVVFRPYGKMHRTISFPAVRRAIRMLEHRFDRVLAEPETPERAERLRDIETRRTALANAVGAC